MYCLPPLQRLDLEEIMLLIEQQKYFQWCARLAQPLVLMLDEVDALVGDTLISLLRQLRAGSLSGSIRAGCSGR